MCEMLPKKKGRCRMITCSECGTVLIEINVDKFFPCVICMTQAHFNGYAEGLKKADEMITKNNEPKKEGGN